MFHLKVTELFCICLCVLVVFFCFFVVVVFFVYMFDNCFKSTVFNLCLVCASDCPVFEVKAKINVLVHSDVFNRSKPFVFTIECFRRLVLSKARTRCNDMTKDQPSNNLISLFNMQILNFPLCLVTVRSGISI